MHHYWFSHEKLEVYQESVSFIAWVSALLEPMARAGDVKDQINRASPALECAAGLDVLVAKQKLTSERIGPGKESLQKIVRMLIGLLKRNSTREYDISAVSDDSM
ncbi:MAG TPA: hypothetical protein VGR35_10015 [Tepidisphaeraceae bacterium]|nr:hypothetical protein [Tepidisphaeraceae bacterium]